MKVIIIPSRPEGISHFVNKKYWDNLKIGDSVAKTIEYIAIYQTAPISKITHYAKVTNFEKYENEIKRYRGNKKYKLKFGDVKSNLDIKLDDSSNRKLIIQSPRYTTLDKLLSSKTLSELFQ